MPRNDDDEDDDDDDRPKKKKKKKSKSMPGLLIASAIVCMVWSGFGIFANCWDAGSSAYSLYHLWHFEQGVNKAFGGNLGGNLAGVIGVSKGFFITIVVVSILVMVLMAATLAGAVALFMRKGLGKYAAIGCPALVALLDVGGAVAILITTNFSIFGLNAIQFVLGFMLALGVAIFNFFALTNRKVAKSLQ